MRPETQLPTPLAWIACIVLIGGGCASPESRAKQNPDAFAQLSAAQKELVLMGSIEKGMSRQAVTIALGPPSRVVAGNHPGNESWIYQKAEFYDIPRWKVQQAGRTNDQSVGVTEYDPIQMKRFVDSLEVVFQEGRVTSWRPIDSKPNRLR